MANPRIVMTLAGVFLAGLGTGMLGMRYGLRTNWDSIRTLHKCVRRCWITG